MGIGERQQEGERMTQEEGCLNPLTKTKDPESAAHNHKQGTWQKLRSSKVSVVYVLVGAGTGFILVIVLSVLSARETPSTIPENPTYVLCPKEWIMYKSICYYISDRFDVWTNSQKFCESQNSSLAVIDNKEEYDFLNRLKDEDNYWIGLSRTEDDSGWVWTNSMPYTENLFRIQRLPVQNKVDSERAFLNHDGVKSGSENIEKKWFCKKRLPNYSS